MITLTDWLKNPDAQKVLLVEIDKNGSPIYIADTPYVTEPGDTPANQHYQAVIAPGGIPRLTRRIQEVWGGRSVASWGPLDLATQFVGSDDLSARNLRDKDLTVLLTGPRGNVNRSDAVKVLTGRIGPRSGNADGGVTLEIQDTQSHWDNIELPINQYDGTESASFPVANIGKGKPVALGLCRNVPAVLIDLGNLVYQVHDVAVSAMQSIDAVYDNGVSVTFTANVAAGTFTLNAPPAGVVTADVHGAKEGSTYHADTTGIIDFMARVFGGLSAAAIDISGLPTGAVGYYISDNTRLSNVITALMTGIIGWWGFGRVGNFKARLFNAPVTGGKVFDQTQQLSDITWTEDPTIIYSVPLRYQPNWTQVQPAASVAGDTAVWLRSNGLSSRVSDNTILTTYTGATTSRLIVTYFDNKVDADAVGSRALALFGTNRRRTHVTLPVGSPLLELADTITLADADVVNGDHIVTGLTDVLDGEIPMMQAEVWG